MRHLRAAKTPTRSKLKKTTLRGWHIYRFPLSLLQTIGVVGGYVLGFDEPVQTSGAHGEGLASLHQALLAAMMKVYPYKHQQAVQRQVVARLCVYAYVHVCKFTSAVARIADHEVPTAAPLDVIRSIRRLAKIA